MAKTRTPQSDSPFMESLFASLEASGAIERAQVDEPQAAPEASQVEAVQSATTVIEVTPEAGGQEPLVARVTRSASVTMTSLGRRKRPESATAAGVAPGITPSSPATPQGALTISALSTHILALFEADALLRDVWVVGEVSNWKRYGSGHAYFSLKDSGATISAVMWRNAVGGHAWLPSDGDLVMAHGYVSIYPERGNYQLYVNQIRPAGRGQLYAAYEALKERLSLEGLFAPERKRPLPGQIARVGVITSRDGAALRDILRIFTLRWPLIDVVIFPAAVQGADCPAQLCAALANANRYSLVIEPLDVLIMARGGGSIEDLWGFNSEDVARAVAASAIPVVAGVGHETDFTIADFVADLRAATPSAAAMAICPNRADLLAQLEAVASQLSSAAETLLDHEADALGQRSVRLARLHPGRTLLLERQRLDDRARRIAASIHRRHRRDTERMGALAQRLSALSPLAVLQRGYSIVQRSTGQVVMGPAMSNPGELLTVRAAHGDYTVERKPDHQAPATKRAKRTEP